MLHALRRLSAGLCVGAALIIAAIGLNGAHARANAAMRESAGACEPEWLPTFGGTTGVSCCWVYALAEFDDGLGGGPALYVGGDMATAGGVNTGGIARWDGSKWSSVGGGVNGTVRALLVFDDGSGSGASLYVAGQFSTAGGVSANSIAKWDGQAWTPLASGVNGAVFALAAFDDGAGGSQSLYVGGAFDHAGGAAAERIAKWNGSVWAEVGGGIGGATAPTVRSLAVFPGTPNGPPALHAGGSFETAGGLAAKNFAKWDGRTWTEVGGGVNSTVHAIETFDDATGGGPGLFVGGAFTMAGETPASRIAKWDGQAWSPLGSGMNSGEVRAMTVFDDRAGGGAALYTAGTFAFAGSVDLTNVGRWDGAAWSSLGSSGVAGTATSLAVFDRPGDGASSLCVGGNFTFVGGNQTTGGTVPAHRVASWDGASWSCLGSGLNSIVYSAAAFDDGMGDGPSLYLGGGFNAAANMFVGSIVRWDGTTWSAVGGGVSNSVLALSVFDDGGGDALYAGGEFSSAGGAHALRIAKWDGLAWSALGSGVGGGAVFTMVVFDDGAGDGHALYAGGSFTSAGGTPANRIARWDGSAWTPLGDGLSGPVRAMAVFDDGLGGGSTLYVGGSFSSAGGATAQNIAKWDGVAWSPVGTGVNGTVYALLTLDADSGVGPALYAGGSFTEAGGIAASRIAKWDGTAWSPLGTGVNSSVRSLALFDDGSGDGLYAGGEFTVAGGVFASRIAKWDGTVWSPLGAGVEGGCCPQVYALVPLDGLAGDDSSLYAGGGFSVSPGSDGFIARWQACQGDCSAADINNDGAFNGADLGLLLGAWGPCTNCDSDLNGDGVVDGADLGGLLSCWTG